MSDLTSLTFVETNDAWKDRQARRIGARPSRRPHPVGCQVKRRRLIGLPSRSGTARHKQLVQLTAVWVEHDQVADRGRDGITGPRRRGDIGYAVLRGGNVAGEHSVVFAADNERIELTHKAGDRSIFARGGVRAALWVRDQPAGLYSVADVLGFSG